MKTKNIIILGGGFAGLRAYYRLHEYHENINIILVDKRAKSLEKPSLPEVAFSGKHINQVLIDLKKIIEHKGGTYINDEVVKINPKLNYIQLKKGEKINYDYLVIASGAIKDFDSIKGFNEFGYSMCDDKHAVKVAI